ncbi:ECF-type sigma factor [Roseateles sp. BYS96W]|uniref:ECF-type sigma factor n=1 Tax=Pelomonas nitida TaxID=3299027 RepID=A0ABW7G6U9_9BURK
MVTQPPITELLAGTARGDAASLQQLYAVLYPEIKRVARIRLAQSGPGSRVAGLDTTALVHEGFLRMADRQGLQGETRGQFFAYVGRVLRSVVIDHLRAEGRDKRGGDAVMVTLSAAAGVAAVQSQAVDLIGLDQALARMSELDARLYELIEMVGFAGLTLAEVALMRNVSTRSINRDLLKARALLQELLGDPPTTVY